MDRQPEVKHIPCHGDIKKHFVSNILYFILHNMTTEAGPSLKQIIEHNLTINKTENEYL